MLTGVQHPERGLIRLHADELAHTLAAPKPPGDAMRLDR